MNPKLVPRKTPFERAEGVMAYRYLRPDYSGYFGNSFYLRLLTTGSFISLRETIDYVTETCRTAGEIRYNPSPQNRTQ